VTTRPLVKAQPEAEARHDGAPVAAIVARPHSGLWFRLRNRVLSNPRFQRWAARFPLTRFVARRRASALFEMCAGFVYSQVLQAVVRLGLLEILVDGPRTAAELAPELALPLEATQRLLDAAASLKLVEKRGRAGYGLGVHGASFMGNPAVSAMVKHHALLYRDLSDPVALLRGELHETELQRFWSYSRAEASTASASTASDVRAYSELMAGSLGLIAEDILEAYPQDRHRCLLDVGGGEGAFLQAAARESPHLSLVLFDLPAVASRAEQRLTQAGLSSRVKVVGGDVFRDPLPEGADLVSLVRVVHDHDDPQALQILSAVRRVLKPGGVLLLAEPMSGTRGAEAMGDAYFGFYLLAMGQGRPRTAAELRALLTGAGFSRVEIRATRRPMFTQLLVATV
jgi:demethylspheroidene O-methyltransferase